MPETNRLELPYPELIDLADVPADIEALAEACDVLVPYGQGALASRPTSTPSTPGIQGRLYLATDSSPNVLYVDYGTGWQSVGFIADGAVGTSQLADHSVTRIKLAMPAVGDTELMNDSVITPKIQDLAVTAAKLAAALKPSQGAGASTEALRALGKGPGLALSINDLQDLNQSGTYANRPAANGVPVGTTYYATDQDAMYRSNGSTWIRQGPRAGDIFLTLNTNAEPGRVLCQGQAWPAQDGIYTDLYSKWGGSNLPDLRGRVPVVVSPGGKALVDNLRDNDGRTAAQRSISHRHSQDPATMYTAGGPRSGSDDIGNPSGLHYTSGDADNLDSPAFYVVQAEAKL